MVLWWKFRKTQTKSVGGFDCSIQTVLIQVPSSIYPQMLFRVGLEEGASQSPIIHDSVS